MRQHRYHGTSRHTYQSQTCLRGLTELWGRGGNMIKQEQDAHTVATHTRFQQPPMDFPLQKPAGAELPPLRVAQHTEMQISASNGLSQGQKHLIRWHRIRWTKAPSRRSSIQELGCFHVLRRTYCLGLPPWIVLWVSVKSKKCGVMCLVLKSHRDNPNFADEW